MSGAHMRVLNLITNRAPFYELQLEALQRHDVAETTLLVPGERSIDGDEVTSRSAIDYLRFFPRVLRYSFDGYDLVHANYGLTAPAALAQLRLPVVVSLWGSDLLGKYGWLSQWCARHADAVIVMSQQMADELEVDCHVVPHGVDLELFRPAPQRAARAEIGWRADVPQVLFPYSPHREVKDYPRAERVLERVRDRYRADVELQTLQNVPHEEMPRYLNAADALLLTSKWEGSPNTVKEAMACNLPVVSTDVGDVPERLADVEPSHVCRSDEELVEGLIDVFERDTRSNGREAVRPLGVDRMGDRLEAIYETVLSENRA